MTPTTIGAIVYMIGAAMCFVFAARYYVHEKTYSPAAVALLSFFWSAFFWWLFALYFAFDAIGRVITWIWREK